MYYAVIRIGSEAYNEAYAVKGSLSLIESAFKDMCENAFSEAAMYEDEEYSPDGIKLPSEFHKLKDYREQQYGGEVSFDVLEESFEAFIESLDEWIGVFDDESVQEAEDTDEFFDFLNDRLATIFE